MGIGSGEGGTCGNITISGGTGAAGIGSGQGTSRNTSSCGTITISGGIVKAEGGQQAAGIGSGVGRSSSKQSSCGSITITTGVKEVSARKGSGATNIIGKGGDNSTCGTVTIGGTSYPDGINLDYQNSYTYNGKPK